MRKIIFLTFLMLPFLGISQVFTNGTFDSDVTGWTNNGGSTVAHDAADGGSLKLTTVAANGRAQSAPNSSPGIAGDYLLTFKVKGTDGSKIQGSIYQGSLIPGLNYTISGTDWQESSYLFTGVADANMNIRIIGKDAASIYFIDDVTFVKVQSITENSFVANADFETAPITTAWTIAGAPDTNLTTVTGNGGGSAAQVTFHQAITSQSNNMLLSSEVDFGQTVNPSSVDATFDALANKTDIQIQLSIRTYNAAGTLLETLNGAAETVAVGDAWEPFTYGNAVTLPFNKILFRVRIKGAAAVLNDYAAIDNITATFTYNQLRNYWLDVDTDWANTANWTYGTIPVATDIVHIETGATNDPIIGATIGAVANNLIVDSGESLTITSGGSLIVAGTSTGDVTYNLAVADTGWHLVSSPVSGEGYDNDWVTANSVALGTNDNRGIATYQNGAEDTDTDGGGTDTATGNWVYMQAGASDTFADGTGYSLKRTASGTYAFTGTVPTADISPAITQSVNNWNLIGNSFPSYLDVGAFVTANTANLGGLFQAVYIWNGTAYVETTDSYLQPGQAFFVSSNVASGTASITEAMQSHQTGITFHKSSDTTTSIKLNITNGTSFKETKINYLEGKTKGIDPGFDIGMFNGVSSDLRIFTHLLDNNDGTSIARQALPNSDLESMIIPVGVKAAAGKEISFTAEALNVPDGIKVFLEDRQTNTFTRLDEANTKYEITLSENLNGVGRFYIHTSAKSALSIDNTILETVRIHKLNNSTLRIAGLSQGKASVKLFNLLGKQVMHTSFEATTSKDLSLPNLATGIYIIQLETEGGKLNKKIILE